MKTTKIGHVTICHHSKTESYVVIINNTTKKIIKYQSQFTKIDKDEIQKMVDKLIEQKMITIFGDETTECDIKIWDIDESKELYIETYHNDPTLPDNELFDDYDSIMKFDDFVKLD